MESRPNVPPLIVIVGETGSGKSALAMELAKKFDGEIVAADSRTIYKHLDIGTAKPTVTERTQVPHHLIDVVEPDETFSVAAFKELADVAIADIAGRGKLPFLVGGSGLYIDAILYNFTFRSKADEALRAKLNSLTIEELHALLTQAGIALPKNSRNPRHLIRAYETQGEKHERHELRPNTLILGIHVEREKLRRTITERVEHMVQHGLIDEAARMSLRYGWEAPGLQAPAYKAFHAYSQGDLSLAEAKALFVQNDMQLAKRQRTWFRRNKSIHWISKKAEAVDLVTTFLNKSYTD